ncbi:HET domain-containing protein, partial [Colletotrichum musicola]
MPIRWVDKSHPPAPQYLTISDQWKVVRVDEQTCDATNKYKVSYPTPGSVAHNPDTADLNVVRSEIRLLYLLPGSGDDPIRCKIGKVSLDDLERAKSRLLATFGKINDEPEVRTSQHDEDDDPDFVPTIIDRVDFSDPANANLTVYDIMTRSQAAKDLLKETNPLSIRYENIDERQGALVSAIMEDRKQKDVITFSRGLPPAYNYEALSYVWGKSTEGHKINLDGQKVVPVTDNLHAALRRLRRLDEPRTLWVDSLCINQDNIAERNRQVQMMGRIYKSAASVVVWLGDTDGIPVPTVSSIDQATDPEDETETDKHDDETKHGKALKLWRENVLRDALSKASPPWWTRSWIIQELVLASELSVAFGPAEVSWSTFYSDLLDTWKSIPELSRIFSLRLNRDRWQYNGSLGETALLARECAATDPRDKIYSILSLVKPEQAALMKPDYGLQEAEIFTQATFTDIWCNITQKDAYDEALTVWHSKGSHGKHPRAPRYPVFSSYGDKGTHQTGLRPDRFRILNWAKPTASRMEGLPSWAVDFSDRACFSEDAHFRLGGERWTFDGTGNLHELASVEMSADRKRLTVRGVIFDRVENVLPEIPVRDYRRCEADMNARLGSIFSRFPIENPYTAATGISGTPKLRTDSLRRVMRPNWIITHTKRNMISVSYEDQATQVLSHWNPSERPIVDWSSLKDVRYSDCEVEGCRCGPSRLFKAWDRSVGVSEDARNFMSPDFEKITSPWENYCPTLKGDA